METVIRVVVIYLFLIFGFRVLGKREFGELSPLELVTLLLIPEIVSQSLSHNDPSLTNGIIGVATLFGMVFLTSLVVHVSPKAEKVISGKPVLLVHDGVMIEDNMNRERISPGEVFTEMHKAGVAELSAVRFVILEPDGQMAVIQHESPERTQETEESHKA